MIERTVFFGKNASHEDAMQAMRWVASTGGSVIFASEGDALYKLTDKRLRNIGQEYDKCKQRYKKKYNINLGVINQSGYDTYGPRVATISLGSDVQTDRLTGIEYDMATHDGVSEFGVYISTFGLIKSWAGYYLPTAEGNVPEGWQEFIYEHSYDDTMPSDIMKALDEVANDARNSWGARFDIDMEDRLKVDIRRNWKHWSVLSPDELLAACSKAGLTIGDAYRVKEIYTKVGNGGTPRPVNAFAPTFEH